MASQEHKFHADFVKNTHATLREESRTHGPEIAWSRHVKRSDILQKYAQSMHELATLHWQQASPEENSTRCRVEWIKKQCMEYFFHGGLEKQNEKEHVITEKIWMYEKVRLVPYSMSSIELNNEENCNQESQKISLLDVGSCYNPFATEEAFDVTAIDLAGADTSVLECDFLNVNIGEKRILSDNGKQVLQLPANTYNVVVFSLFLEYLPCPSQRFQCCVKAYELLKPTGILVIVSPDSNHIGANAGLMKSWRYILSRVGFLRITYEKLKHLQCLVFRKAIYKDIAVRWATIRKIPENDVLYENLTSIHIPQDLQKLSNKDNNCATNDSVAYSANELLEGFAELPSKF